MKRQTVLYFGSFNPIHNGHIAIAEYMARRGNEVWFVVSPQNPLKPTGSLAPDEDRLKMVETALRAAANPSLGLCDIEFGLPRPSYTVDTLRALEARYPERSFSLLAGSDVLAEFTRWKDYRTLLDDYPIWIYPRREGEDAGEFAGRVKILKDAPLQEFSSTEVRQRLERGDDCGGMVPPGVLRYIDEHGLYAPSADRMTALSEAIAQTPDDTGLLMERGRLLYRNNEFGPALNDFLRVLRLDPGNVQAGQYADTVRQILDFRYKDIYNP